MLHTLIESIAKGKLVQNRTVYTICGPNQNISHLIPLLNKYVMVLNYAVSGKSQVSCLCENEY